MKWLKKGSLIIGVGWLGYGLALIVKQPAILKTLSIAILFLSFSVLPAIIKKTKEEMTRQAKEFRMTNTFTPSVNQSGRWQ